LFSSVGLFQNALLVLGSEQQRAELLPALIAGAATGAAAHVEPSGDADPGTIAALAGPSGGDFVLSGTKSYVIDGGSADHLIVAARAESSRGDHGISLFLLPGDAPGVTRRFLPTLDQTRKLAEISLSDVRVPASALLGAEGEGAPLLERVLDLGRIALAAEQVGAAERCLEMAIEYAKVRVQFGRPIGSFQAIKHQLAEIFVEVESARSACYYAASVAASGGAELSRAASLAKAYCSEAFFHAAAENIQIHGGVGFTWEHDAHLYFKRAKASELLLGDPAYHRERYARLIGI
jgi:alkylation response protein AidB-like acyl-CoA dehydrogenase